MSPIKADFPESSGSHRERDKPVYFSKRARSILQDVYATNGGKTPNEQEREALAKELSKLDGRLYLEKKITFWFYNRRKNQRAAAGRKAESTAEKADMSARSGPVETILRSIPADDLKSWAAVSKTLKDNGLEVARDTQRLLELQRAIHESSMRSNMPLKPEQQKSTVLSQLPTPASSKSPEIKPRDSPAAISPIEGSPSLYSHLLPPVYNTSPSSSSTGALLKNDQSSETLSQSSQAATTPEPLCFKDAEKSVQPATPPASASTVRAPETMDVDEPTHQVALPTALAPACATPVMSQVLWDAQSVTTDRTPPIPYWEIKTADPRRRHPANRYSAGDSTAVTPAAPSAMAKNVAPPPLKSTSSARTVDPRRRPNTMPAQVTSSRVTGPSLVRD